MRRDTLSLKVIVGVTAVVLLIMLVDLLWSIRLSQRQGEAELKEKAQVICQQLIATRSFIASKQDLINEDGRGNFHFKHLNPAAVGKGISDKFNRFSGYSFKQTRFQVRDPENAPDGFEIDRMQQLAADPGLTETWGYDTLDGVRVFRYMSPLYYDASCMPCHGGPAGVRDVSGYVREGHQDGEFAGAISVVFPMTAFEEHRREALLTQIAFSLLLVLAMVGMIYVLLKRIVIQPITQLADKLAMVGEGKWTQFRPHHSNDEMRVLSDKFNEMSANLNNLYDTLENKVAERTEQLRETNARLAEQGRELREMYEKLYTADQLKSEFLAVMSHELKTPLTSIIAFSEILLMENEKLSPQHQEYLEDIFDCSHQLLGQINDILDMSKIEAGLLRINPHPTDFRQLLESLLVVVRPIFARKHIDLSVHLQGAWPMLMLDADKLRHILNNLISNAVKYTDAGGHVHISGAIEAGCLVIEVADDGIGIPEEEQPYIFDRFHQVQYSDGREQQGSGLGLEIVRNLLELQGGSIRVQSVWGAGSSFVFSLPLQAFISEGQEE